MKKKIDERIITLIENCVKLNQRSLFLIVGDRGLYQIVNLHQILAKTKGKAQPSVLWCYKKELELSSNKQKRVKQVRRLQQKGNLDEEEVNQIELFMTSKDIRYCYYKDTHKILGQTFGMCIIQDFESVTPNVLCRAIETVEGGGIVVLLFNTLTSLKQLYSITMDVHSRYRTEAHQFIQPRFNERFILSLGECKSCMAIDDELNILPLTQNIKDIKPVNLPGMQKSGDIENKSAAESIYLTDEQKKLVELKKSLKDTKPLGNLVSLCRTLDQASSVMQMVDNISEKSLKSTISLTAGRGRGKSAALGIALSSAIVHGFSNIFVTAPSPENLITVFEFVFKGLDALNYKEHTDYEILQSTNPEFNHAVVRVNIYRDHRQTIQYVRPQDCAALTQAELLVVDEAAAIPITLVKQLLGPYMVILSSTIHGYEGTGRSLSLKLLNSLREQTMLRNAHQQQNKSGALNSRTLMDVELEEPIRYGVNDPVEKWLNSLLCLDATKEADPLEWGFPHPSQTELYFVNRDTLFSYHPSSERFLNKLMTIFVSSHYKNTPNDLQMLSDAPAHQIFVLLGPLRSDGGLPDILCAIQVCFEGEISKSSIADQLKRGKAPSGDLIPWTISEQFQDDNFGQLNGLRIVRIATHPGAQGKGYGSKAMDLLIKYYEGQLIDADAKNFTNEQEDLKPMKDQEVKISSKTQLKEEKVKPKKHLKPILQKLTERAPIPIHYIGTSFGVTKELLNFWRKNKFESVYVRQTANDLTGEHSCLMIRPLSGQGEVSLPSGMAQNGDWLQLYTNDFKRRMVSLLGFEFRAMNAGLGYQFVARLAQAQGEQNIELEPVSREQIERFISVFDLKRLDSYSNNLVDFHLIMDLVPTIAKLHFVELKQSQVPNLSYVQTALLVGMGLQYKTIDSLQKDLNLAANQLLPLFNKAICKYCKLVKQSYEQDAEKVIQVEEKLAKEATVQLQEQIKQKNAIALREELKTGAGTQMAQDMQDVKDSFMKSVNKSKNRANMEGFSTKDAPVSNQIIAIQRKEEESEEEELVEIKSKKKANKRAKH